jgi:DNA-binding MarR family transcriptional regulator
MSRVRRDDLTPGVKRALLMILANGNVIRGARGWHGGDGGIVVAQTVEALYDRYLVKIVVENRHRRRHTLTLTDIGERVARDLQREALEYEAISGPPRQVSENAQRLIVEMVA